MFVLAAASALGGAAGEPGIIVSSGPLTRILVSPDLNCQVAHEDDQLFEFFGLETGACGTFLAVGGTLYGPADVPSGGSASPRTPWTPVERSEPRGTGSEADPFVVVTVVDAGGSGIRVEQRDSYVAGEESYRTDIRLTNVGPAEQRGILYRAGDCFLQDSDVGFGHIDDGAPACVISPAPDARIEQWLPLSPGSQHIEASFDEVWATIGAQRPFPDTCACSTAIDNAAGLSWDVTIPAGGSVTHSHLTFFSPEGRRPTTPLRDSVPDPLEISLDPLVIAQTAVITAGVVLLVPFPATLFNATLEEHYDEVMGWVAGLRSRLARALSALGLRIRRALAGASPGPAEGDATVVPGTGPPVRLPPWTGTVARRLASEAFWRTPQGIALFVLVSAFLYGLLDPTFWFDAASLATLVGLVAGLGAVVAVFTTSLWIVSRRGGAGLVARALPGTLVIAAACVVISRVADFQPGYIYGLVVGYAFSREAARVEQGRWMAVATAALLGAAYVAWLALVVVRAGGAGGLTTFALETACATIVVAGLEGAVFAMMPVRFLPGEKVRAWDRRVWIALTAMGTAGVLHILLDPSTGYLADSSRSSFLTVIVLLVGFGIASVAFWAWFRYRPGASAPPDGTGTSSATTPTRP
jgi:hypothetical protein